MATAITFNGRVTARPGSYTRVDASALARAALSASGIVACIGEAKGGAPYTVAGDGGIHRISNAGKVGRVFHDGDLLEAGQFLFDPSLDPDIQGGAQEVIFVKVNPATQGAVDLLGADGDTALTITDVNYGVFTTAIQVETGTLGGKLITVRSVGSDGQEIDETFDNVGSSSWITLDHELGSGVTATGTATGLTLSTALGGSVPTMPLPTVTFIGTSDQFATPFSPTSPSAMTLVSDGVGDNRVVYLWGETAGGSLIEEAVTLNGTTPVTTTHATFAKIHGAGTQGDNTTPTITVSDGDGALFTLCGPSAATTAGCGVVAVGSIGGVAGVHVRNEALTFVADAATTAKIVVVGSDASGDPVAELLTLNGTTPVTTATLWSKYTHIAAGAVSPSRTVVCTGVQWVGGVVVVSDSALDAGKTIHLVGLVGSSATIETVVLDGTTPVAADTAFTYPLGATGLAAWVGGGANVPAGAISIRSALGGVDVSGSGYQGFTYDNPGLLAVQCGVGGGVTGGVGLGYDVSGASGKLYALGRSGTGQPQAVTLIGGTAAGTTTQKWTYLEGVAPDFRASGPVSMTVALAAPVYADYVNLASMCASFMPLAGMKATIDHARATKISASGLDLFGATALSTPLAVYGLNYDIADKINGASALVTATRSSTSRLVNTAAIYLLGGSEGTTQFANWQGALDKLKGYRVNTIVALTGDEAVHAAVAAHCRWAAGPGRSERDAILGPDSGRTLTQLKTATLALNTRHVRLAGQDVVRFNQGGVREQFPPYFTAAIGAGMQAASEVGTSLTWKYLNVLDVVGHDASYKIEDDAEEIIQSGILAIERVDGVGYRWLRNVTTHQIDDNPAYTEGGVNAAVNFAVYEFRRRMEIVVGKKGFDGLVTTAQAEAVAILGELIGDKVITGWHSLQITLTGDVMEIDVAMAPVESVNFVTSNIHLVTSTFARAA